MFFGRTHPDDQPILKAAVEKTLREKIPFDVEYRFIIPGQPVKFIHARADLVQDPSGELSLLRGTGQDITERKHAEERVNRSEQFIRGILDTVDEGFIVIDRDYRIVTANKAYCTQTSHPSDEVIGRHCYEISHRSSTPCYEAGEECAVREVFATGEPHAALHKHSDNEHTLYVETKAYPIKDEAGRITSVIETINNITEKYLLEEERLKTQKLESIGTLAGGIAHDFNNLLQGVFGYISLAKMVFDQKEKSFAMLEQAEQALHQSVSLTTQLLTFSKGGRPIKQRVALLPIIENAAKFALSGSRVQCLFEIEPGLWQVEADAGQVAQVIQNIVLNADQAMPQGGRVTITARNISRSSDSVAAHPGLERNDYVEISVADQGVGIPKEHRNKIFDPYFTTKEKGSGLGLATSYSIIKNHGGRIYALPDEGGGTIITFYLPALPLAAETPVARIPAAAYRKARVLVMDDEEMIRKIAGELLAVMGHEVEFAEDGAAALEKYHAAQEAGRPFDVVILDLTVRGGMGGAEAIAELQKLDPGVKAVVSSGYGGSEVLASYRSYGFHAILNKPYKFADLHATLNELLK